MKKKLALILPALLILGLEYFLCWNDLKAISPFPLAECWYRTLNHFLRDFLLLGTGLNDGFQLRKTFEYL